MRDMTVDFGGLRALNVSNLTIPAGKVIALIGPNGAGKTTLFNAITGVVPLSSGRIYFNDCDITGLEPYKIARLGIRRTFQDPRVFNSLSVRKNIEISADQNAENPFASICRRMDHAISSRVDHLLKTMELFDKQDDFPPSLSFGEQRFLSIAIALAREGGRLILLDEPSVGLDQMGTTILKRFIRTLVTEGPGILLVEHNMDIVMDISDLVVLLIEGKVVAMATPREIQQDPSAFRNYMGRGIDAGSKSG